MLLMVQQAQLKKYKIATVLEDIPSENMVLINFKIHCEYKMAVLFTIGYNKDKPYSVSLISRLFFDLYIVNK